MLVSISSTRLLAFVAELASWADALATLCEPTVNSFVTHPISVNESFNACCIFTRDSCSFLKSPSNTISPLSLKSPFEISERILSTSSMYVLRFKQVTFKASHTIPTSSFLPLYFERNLSAERFIFPSIVIALLINPNLALNLESMITRQTKTATITTIQFVAVTFLISSSELYTLAWVS